MTNFQPLELSQIETFTSMMQDFYAIDNYPIDIETSKKLFHEFIADENLGKCWLIYHDGEIVGYTILTFIFSFEYKGRIAFLDELYLQENARGKGIGKKLFDYVLEYAKKLGCYNLTLNVWEGNDSAMQFYKNIGLRIQKIGMEKILSSSLEL